jgi:hypothetical protein
MESNRETSIRAWAKELSRLVEPGAPARLFMAATKDRRFYVQFDNNPQRSPDDTFDKGATLWLDVPCRGMNPDEAEWASTFFSAHGVDGPSELKAMGREDEREFMLAAWRLDCGTDPVRAAGIAFDLLEQVFGLTDEVLAGYSWDADE